MVLHLRKKNTKRGESYAGSSASKVMYPVCACFVLLLPDVQAKLNKYSEERIHMPHWDSGNNPAASLIAVHTQRHPAVHTAWEAAGCIQKQGESHRRSKDEQGVVLTWLLWGYHLSFWQGTNCKVKPSCFNERSVMNLLILMLAKIKYKVCIILGYRQRIHSCSESTLQENTIHLTATLVLGEGLGIFYELTHR